jgi:hypothetical protein
MTKSRASRSKRALNCSLVILMATARPNRVSTARNTSTHAALAELAFDTVWPHARPDGHLSESQILQQFRDILNDRPIQEFDAGSPRKKRFQFTA